MWRRSMPSDVWAPMFTNNLSLLNKSLCARMKVAHDEPFQQGARFVPQYAVTATYENREQKSKNNFFVFLEKRAMPRSNFITATFEKS